MEKFVVTLNKVIATLSAEEQMIMWEFIFHFLETTKAPAETAKQQAIVLKPRTLETLMSLIGAKTGVPSWVSKNWFHVIKTYSLEDFNDTLMPSLQRQMLRSPEVTIGS